MKPKVTSRHYVRLDRKEDSIHVKLEQFPRWPIKVEGKPLQKEDFEITPVNLKHIQAVKKIPRREWKKTATSYSVQDDWFYIYAMPYHRYKIEFKNGTIYEMKTINDRVMSFTK